MRSSFPADLTTILSSQIHAAIVSVSNNDKERKQGVSLTLQQTTGTIDSEEKIQGIFPNFSGKIP